MIRKRHLKKYFLTTLALILVVSLNICITSAAQALTVTPDTFPEVTKNTNLHCTETAVEPVAAGTENQNRRFAPDTQTLPRSSTLLCCQNHGLITKIDKAPLQKFFDLTPDAIHYSLAATLIQPQALSSNSFYTTHSPPALELVGTIFKRE